MKRLMFVLLCAASVMAINAQNPSGKCGKNGGSNLTWELNLSTGELVITGSGEMDDFSGGSVPWRNYDKDIQSVSLPKGLKNIGYHAFQSCSNLTAISFPSSLESIGYEAFRESGLESLTIPVTVKFVDLNAFHSCHSLKTVDIQSTMSENDNKIAGYTFYYCDALETVTIPEGIKRFGEQAFGSCTALKKLVLPSTTYIMDEAFSGCSGIDTLICKAVVPPICHNGAFKDVKASIPVLVPATALKAYTEEEWEDFTNFQIIPGSEIDAVIAAIDAIGIVELTDESKALIDAAREAYDALTDAQKAEVDNYELLVAAEAAYAELKATAEELEAALKELTDSIASAQALYNQIKNNQDLAAVASALNEAISAAQAVLVTAGITPEQVELAITALNVAVEAAKEALELLGIDVVLGGSDLQNRKFFHKGQLYIIHNGKIYNVNGAER